MWPTSISLPAVLVGLLFCGASGQEGSSYATQRVSTESWDGLGRHTVIPSSENKVVCAALCSANLNANPACQVFFYDAPTSDCLLGSSEFLVTTSDPAVAGISLAINQDHVPFNPCPSPETINLAPNAPYTIESYGYSSFTDYRPFTNCLWMFSAPTNTKIFVYSADIFLLEFSTSCINDFVDVYNGLGNSDPALKTQSFCGTATPVDWFHNAQDMSIHFATNGNVSHRGFSLTVEALSCGGEIFVPVGDNVTISTTEAFPSGFYPPIHCKWAVSTQSGNEIVAKVTRATMYGMSCTGTNSFSIKQGTRHSTAIPLTGLSDICSLNAVGMVALNIASNYNPMWVDLLMSESGSATPLDMDVEFYSWPTSYSCPTEIELRTVPAAGLMFSFPWVEGAKYWNSLLCEWRFRSDNGAAVRATFTRMDTESNFDKVSVYDSNDLLLNTLTGTSLPPAPYLSVGDNLRFKFTSDSSVTKTGFSVHFTHG